MTGCGAQQTLAQESRAAKETQRPNILLITIDTLRADHLGCYGYFRDTSPNIDRFAEESIFFDRAYCPMAVTLPSHMSLLTGLYPNEHGILANLDHGGRSFSVRSKVKTVAQRLHRVKYATAGFVSAAPLKRNTGLYVGFEAYDQPERLERKAEDTNSQVFAWLEQHGKKAFFLWVHYFDPHLPFRPPEPYKTMYQTDEALEAHLAKLEVADFVAAGPCNKDSHAQKAWNLYDGEVRYVDHEIGRLFDKVRQRGLWDNTIVILTSDHGEGLNQHNWPVHGRTYNEQLHVPLIIRFPGNRTDLPSRFQPCVSLADVFPTVLTQADFKIAKTFTKQATGVDVFSPGFVELPVFSQRTGRDCPDMLGPRNSLTTRQWKFIHRPEEGDLLFDLVNDPYELSNVLEREPVIADTLRQQLLARLAAQETRAGQLGQRRVQPGQQERDEELLRQMEALGYIDTQTPTSQPSSAEAMDS